MKIIYVDIDDVLLMHKGEFACKPFLDELNCFGDTKKLIEYYSPLFDKNHMNRLKEITKLGVKIIVHSSWRHFIGLKEFKTIFKLYGINKKDVIDVCPNFFSSSKRRGVSSSLEKYKPDNYVIIDNEDFIKEENPNFLLIDETIGFDNSYFLIAKKILQIT
jgi:hypothetical protein